MRHTQKQLIRQRLRARLATHAHQFPTATVEGMKYATAPALDALAEWIGVVHLADFAEERVGAVAEVAVDTMIDALALTRKLDERGWMLARVLGDEVA